MISQPCLDQRLISNQIDNQNYLLSCGAKVSSLWSFLGLLDPNTPFEVVAVAFFDVISCFSMTDQNGVNDVSNVCKG
jgi:hypothetical protein